MSDVTLLLKKIESGEDGAVDELFGIVYDDLRQLARQKMRSEPAGHTLQSTALVNEAYIRLVKQVESGLSCANRRHFFATAADAMRKILIDSARRKKRQKRGGAQKRQELLDQHAAKSDSSFDFLSLNEALDRLKNEYPEVGELVMLKFFSNLTMAEIASIIEVPKRTCDRLWAFAKSWLYNELTTDF